MMELEPQDGLDLFDHVAVSAAKLAKTFKKPDDDWLQYAFIEGIDGDGDDVRSIVGPIDNLIGEFGPDITWRIVVPGLLEQFHATRVVVLLNTWQVHGDDAKAAIDETIRPKDHPNRIEVLTLMDITSEGVQNAGMARIFRDEGKPPRLGEWDDWSVAEMDGRIVEGLVPAMKKEKRP